MRKGGAYDRSIRALSLIYGLIGVAILITTLVQGGGPTSVGFLIGLAFIAVGVGRIWIQRRIAREESE